MASTAPTAVPGDTGGDDLTSVLDVTPPPGDLMRPEPPRTIVRLPPSLTDDLSIAGTPPAVGRNPRRPPPPEPEVPGPPPYDAAQEWGAAEDPTGTPPLTVAVGLAALAVIILTLTLLVA